MFTGIDGQLADRKTKPAMVTHPKKGNKETLCVTYNCESYGCYNVATVKIRISAGEFGDITLDLCNYCVWKFKGTHN